MDIISCLYYRNQIVIITMKINLWDIRWSKRLTLVQVEQMTGISKSALNRIENGKKCPNMIEMERLALGLNVKINDLFDSPIR